jgi:hypothetical protein
VAILDLLTYKLTIINEHLCTHIFKQIIEEDALLVIGLSRDEALLLTLAESNLEARRLEKKCFQIRILSRLENIPDVWYTQSTQNSNEVPPH